MRLPCWWAFLVIGCGRVDFDLSPVESFQRGEYPLTTMPLTVAIEPVDPARSFTVCDFRTGMSNHDWLPTCELSGSNEVVLAAGRADPSIVAAFQVIELAGGIRVQRGTTSFLSTDLMKSVTLDPVSRDHAFVLSALRTTNMAENFDDAFTVTSRLADDSTLELTRNRAGGPLDVVWQVIELDDAVVQSGETTIPNGSFSANATIAPVEVDHTFVVETYRGRSGIDAEYLTRGELTGPDTLTFTRTSMASSVDVSWFAVTLGGNARVQHGTIPFGSNATVIQPIAPVVLARTAVFSSFSGGVSGMITGRIAVMARSKLSTTSLDYTRSPMNDVGATASWFVVSWGP